MYFYVEGLSPINTFPGHKPVLCWLWSWRDALWWVWLNIEGFYSNDLGEVTSEMWRKRYHKYQTVFRRMHVVQEKAKHGRWTDRQMTDKMMHFASLVPQILMPSLTLKFWFVKFRYSKIFQRCVSAKLKPKRQQLPYNANI